MKSLLLLISLLPLPVFANPWQGGDWQVANAAKSPAAVQALTDFAFPAHIDEASRKGLRTDALLIIKDGKLVYEKYARGYHQNSAHLTWSMSKSVMSALYGRLVLQGKVNIDTAIGEKSPWITDEGVKTVTYDDLLSMASGIDWQESYEYAPVFSSVVAMLYTRGHDDMAKFVSEQGLAHKPGTFWRYSSGDTTLLSGLLKDIVGAEAHTDLPWTLLFEPLGMKSPVWEQDKKGNFVGGSYLYASARDMARFGYLFLNDGMWNGQRLLPAGWVDYSCSVNKAYKQSWINGHIKSSRPYGAQWWLNIEDKSINMMPAWPDAPRNICVASGHWSQMVALFPTENMMVVRMADDREGDGKYSYNEIFKLALKAFASEQGANK